MCNFSRKVCFFDIVILWLGRVEEERGPGGGGHLYFRLDIILIIGLSKNTLNTYFSGMKIDPKYAFLHVFFLICPSCPFQNLLLWSKTHPFFSPLLHIFAPLNNVHAYIALSWKTTLIMWFFLRGWYPTSNASGPPGREGYLQFPLKMVPVYRRNKQTSKQTNKDFVRIINHFLSDIKAGFLSITEFY